MQENVVVVITVIFTYVHLFNKIATMYFDTDRTLQLEDLYRRVVPPMNFHIQL
jgi:hypothetical protein